MLSANEKKEMRFFHRNIQVGDCSSNFSNRGEGVSKTLIRQIPLISNCKEVIEIKKGYSSDEKYLLHMQDECNKLLIRMFNLEELELKKAEYSILERMQDFNITCSQPIAIGEIGNRGI